MLAPNREITLWPWGEERSEDENEESGPGPP